MIEFTQIHCTLRKFAGEIGFSLHKEFSGGRRVRFSIIGNDRKGNSIIGRNSLDTMHLEVLHVHFIYGLAIIGRHSLDTMHLQGDSCGFVSQEFRRLVAFPSRKCTCKGSVCISSKELRPRIEFTQITCPCRGFACISSKEFPSSVAIPQRKCTWRGTMCSPSTEFRPLVEFTQINCSCRCSIQTAYCIEVFPSYNRLFFPKR